MSRLKASAFILALILLLPFGKGQASQTVKVVLSNNPPLSFTDEQGEPAGIYVDVINYIAEQEDWAIDFVPCKWQECQDKVKTGEIDLLMSVALTEKRSEIFSFTKESVFNNWAIIYRKPLSQIESIGDLEDERVAVGKGNIHTSAFISLIEQFGIDATVIEVGDYQDVVKAIDKGEASAGVLNRVNGIKFESEFDVEKTSIIFNPVNLYFATPKGKHSALRAVIDKHVKRLRTDNRSVYYKSLNRWLSGIQSTVTFEPDSLVDERPVYFAGNSSAQPFESLENGYPVGMNIDVLRELSRVMERRFEIRLMEWSQAQDQVLNNHADALTLLTPSKRRRELYDFSDTVLNLEFTLFKRSKDFSIQSLKDMKGKVIGTHEGGYSKQVLESNRNVKLEYIESDLEGFNLLKEGKIDAVATMKWTGAYMIQQNNIDGITILEKPFASKESSIVVKKGNEKLLDAINLGISKLKQEGTIDKVIANWSEKEVVFITVERIRFYEMLISIFVLVVIIAGSLFWTFTLRKQVTKKTSQLKDAHDSLEIKVVERTEELSAELEARIKAEEERRKLEVQLQHSQKMESLGVLAGGIAHDFNNLLMGIMGNVGMAQMKMSPESPGYVHIERIETAAERAAELTNQMLAYSGRGKFVVKIINLSSVLEEMSHLLQVSVSKNIVIKYELDKDLPAIEVDPSQFHQILMNLLTNASDSFDGKSGNVVVSTGVKVCDKACLSDFQFGDELPEGKYVYLEVSDTGSGMDEEVIASIFDPFFSTKEGGRGLGLSAVIGIVKGHNGAIKVISEPGCGTTFKLLFPASEKTAEEIVEEKLVHVDYRGEGTILVVDDEEGVREIATAILAEFGFEVLLASDGEEALELFKERADEISLVLLDLSMPGMGGIETFRHLKQHWEDVKVILSSGYTEEDAVSAFTGKGLADFIHKPYRPEELISKVRKVLEK